MGGTREAKLVTRPQEWSHDCCREFEVVDLQEENERRSY